MSLWLVLTVPSVVSLVVGFLLLRYDDDRPLGWFLLAIALSVVALLSKLWVAIR
jgi:hypothetical protein